MNYYARKIRAPRSHCLSPHMSNRHLWQLKKSKSWGPFWSYQLNSTANPAHLPQNLGQMGWIGSALLEFCVFLNCHGCQTFILAEIHCYLGVRIFLCIIIHLQLPWCSRLKLASPISFSDKNVIWQQSSTGHGCWVYSNAHYIPFHLGSSWDDVKKNSQKTFAGNFN